MNIYITGHGYEMKGNSDASLSVPAKFTLKFYCKKGEMFDSSWEQFIVESGGTTADCPNDKGTSDWEVSTVAAGAQFEEHCLTRPGKMRTFKVLADMKEIKVPQKGVGLISEAVEDGDILCIKGGGKLFAGGMEAGECWLSMSSLMAALAQKIPDGATVHWCACRSVLTDASAAIEQAQSPYLGKL